MKIEKVIYEMLIENTGRHFLDSGGAYGRHWETNQKKSLIDFKNESSVSFEIYEDEINYTISLFHYLTNQLELNPVCDTFNHFNKQAPDWDYKQFYGVSKKAGNYLELIASKIGEPFNTYNAESSLSQVLQGAYVVINNQYYVLLQIHNGCDVRGGYTNARLFKLDEDAGEWLHSEGVYGTVDGKSVSNSYDGINLTDEDTDEIIKVNFKSKVNLMLIG